MHAHMHALWHDGLTYKHCFTCTFTNTQSHNFQSLEPIYKKLGEKFKKLSPDVVIAKMDATANDKMPGYEVSGFPTLYFAPKGGKDQVRSSAKRW